MEKCDHKWRTSPHGTFCDNCGKEFIMDIEQLKVKSEIFSETKPKHKQHNVGSSDYSKHNIQPWDIWREYKLNPWDADIIKRTLRTKEGNSRIMDYKKIIHICEERIAQLEGVYDD